MVKPATTWSSNRKLPTTGHECRRSTMPIFSSSRGSLICDGAPTICCSNRPSPARCLGSAIQRLRPCWLCCPRRSSLKGLRRQDGFPGVELLALLLDSRILFKIAAGCEGDLRRAEGDDGLVLWDFHDLLFHTRSTEGRHANVQGGLYPYVGTIAPLAPVRPRWPGKKIDLTKYRSANSQVRGTGRRAPASTPFYPQLRRSTADHACRARTISRRCRPCPIKVERPAGTWRPHSES